MIAVVAFVIFTECFFNTGQQTVEESRLEEPFSKITDLLLLYLFVNAVLNSHRLNSNLAY